MSLKVKTVKFSPFTDQEPGTSGLRKSVKVFQKENYTESFVQSILQFVLKTNPKSSTLVLGGDGRFLVKETAKLIINMCAANKIEKIYVGLNGILSTPAASHLIRLYKATGGILLTASHNPGGPDKDFGIKFNTSNGGPAISVVTNEIYQTSKRLTEYKILENFECSIDKLSTFTIEVDGNTTTVEVIDPVASYVDLMKSIFDFNQIGKLAKKDMKILVDPMSGVTGPYAKRIFVDELKFKAESVIRSEPLVDFGGGHPDPNLVYADLLVKKMKEGDYEFGVAFDGDGDRNMILGKKGFFVAPSDSLAIIASNINCINYFKKNGVTGFARSMPTAPAIDKVGEINKIPVFETPTGWKYFGNLMDANKVSLCGEESFGTGSNHIREKDGIWAALAWLNIMSSLDKNVNDIVAQHWKKYGRIYTTRYDYEEISTESAQKIVQHIETTITSANYPGTTFGGKYRVKLADNFSYTDPTDKSVAKNQGLRVITDDGSRIIYRLSGTGSSGATLRIYVEAYEAERINEERGVILKELCNYAVELAKVKEFAKRDSPTVIT